MALLRVKLGERTDGRPFEGEALDDVPVWKPDTKSWDTAPFPGGPGGLDVTQVPKVLFVDELLGVAVFGYADVTYQKTGSGTPGAPFMHFGADTGAGFGSQPAESGGIRLSQQSNGGTVTTRNNENDRDNLVLVVSGVDDDIAIGELDPGANTNAHVIVRGTDEVLWQGNFGYFEGGLHLEAQDVGDNGGLTLSAFPTRLLGEGFNARMLAGSTEDEGQNSGVALIRGGDHESTGNPTGGQGGRSESRAGDSTGSGGGGTYTGGTSRQRGGDALGSGGGGLYTGGESVNLGGDALDDTGTGGGAGCQAGKGGLEGGAAYLVGGEGVLGNGGPVQIIAGDGALGPGIISLEKGAINFDGDGSNPTRMTAAGEWGFFNASPQGQQADLGAFIDNGTPSGTNTLVDVGAVPTQANINNNFATIAVWLNSLRSDTLQGFGFWA